MSKERIGAISASLLGIIALFLPWFTDEFFGVSISLNIFEIIEIARNFEVENTAMYIVIGCVAIPLLVASLIFVASYRHASPHVSEACLMLELLLSTVAI